ESPPLPGQRRAYPPQFGHHIRPCTKQSSEFQADCAARRYQSVDLQDLQNTPQMPPSHPPPASLNTMRVESILFHPATRSRNVKNIPNAIPLRGGWRRIPCSSQKKFPVPRRTGNLPQRLDIALQKRSARLRNSGETGENPRV